MACKRNYHKIHLNRYISTNLFLISHYNFAVYYWKNISLTPKSMFFKLNKVIWKVPTLWEGFKKLINHKIHLNRYINTNLFLISHCNFAVYFWKNIYLTPKNTFFKLNKVILKNSAWECLKNEIITKFT